MTTAPWRLYYWWQLLGTVGHFERWRSQGFSGSPSELTARRLLYQAMKEPSR